METLIIIIVILFVANIESSFDEALEATIKIVAPKKIIEKIESNKYFQAVDSSMSVYSIVSLVVSILLIF